MNYTDSYEIRRSNVELLINDVTYTIDYTIKSPIDGVAEEVNASFLRIENGVSSRIGWGNYSQGVSNVRFDSRFTIPFVAQKAMCDQFMNDLDNILG